MPKAKKPVETPETQFKRFQETADKIGVDPAVAEKVFGSLAQKSKKARTIPSDEKSGKPLRPGPMSRSKQA